MVRHPYGVAPLVSSKSVRTNDSEMLNLSNLNERLAEVLTANDMRS